MKLILIGLAACVIFAVISVLNDEKHVLKLQKNLVSAGYCISDRVDIPDIKKDNEPYCFLVDKTNKKWFLANYKATYADAYDFSDMVDYKVSYRLKGTTITKGEEKSASGSQFFDSGARIFDEVDINKDNCEYIAFSLTFKGSVLNSAVCNSFVLYESQRGFVYAKNHDFVTPSVRIEEARSFEGLLYEIISVNKQYVKE